MTQKETKLGLGALTALVVGSMIGGGIFSIPQNMAESASAGAVIIGWSITAVGMLMLAFVFQTLANRKPDLDSGVYAYAKAGFGNYIGFSSAWGYWISAWLGNVSYLVLVFATLGYFFPVFGEGTTTVAIIAASALLWLMHFLVLRGIQGAAFINQITTIAKVVPILTFIVLVGLSFKAGVFTQDFWGQGNTELGSVMDQVRNMMLVTVWVFIGIEGASVYSGKAKRRSDVGKATVMGFLGTLALLVMVNLLAMGVMSQPELAALDNPSMAYVLEHVVGKWGAAFISVGLIISLVGAFLSWTLLCGEILYSAASDKTMPSFLQQENHNGVPGNALWLSNGCIQLFLFITLFNDSSYLDLLYLASSMILLPYFFSGAYALMIAVNKDGYEPTENTARDLLIGLISVIYSIWLLYAAGPQYLLLSALFYAPGAILYIIARKEEGKTVFNSFEKLIFVASILAAMYSVYGLWVGKLSI